MNNRGWGLQAMMVMVFILMIALVIVAVIASTKLNSLFPSGETYNQLENEVIEALKKYEADYIDYLNYNAETIINIRTLQNQNLLNKLVDQNNNNCSGYGTIIKKSQGIIYKAYIKCGDYKTDGYES